MIISAEELLKDGWEVDTVFGLKTKFSKTINGFHYSISHETDYDEDTETFYETSGNWFDWRLHVDNPDFESVASLEVSRMEDIKLVTEIYKA